MGRLLTLTRTNTIKMGVRKEAFRPSIKIGRKSLGFVTIVLFLESSLFAISKATLIAAPDDIPAGIPSSFARRLAKIPASSSLTFTISSINELSKIEGTKPAPIPCILCAPGASPDKTADE